MCFAKERLPYVQVMIMACKDTADAKEAAKYEKERRAALWKLRPVQRKDFRGLFQAMDGLPVTIRTLDPPLHEFLPRREELMAEVAVLRAEWQRAKKRSKSARKPVRLSKAEAMLERVEELHEFNPMLGHRG